jgi:ribosomal protein S18 acetylase RimI-like enzyme
MTQAVRIVTITWNDMQQNVERFVALGDPQLGWPAEKFLSNRPGKWQLSLAAHDGDTLIGCLIASYRRPGIPHIHLLQVDHRHRNLGIGKSLMDRYLKRVKSTSTLKVEVANRRAVAFYERQGFRITTRKGDHFWMHSASPGTAQ